MKKQILLKPKQRLIHADLVQRLELNSNKVKKTKPSRLYLLKDAVLIVKQVKEPETLEQDMKAIFEAGNAGKKKQDLEYRNLIPVDFTECVSEADSKDGKNGGDNKF